MERFFLEACAMGALVYGIFYYRRKFINSVIHHRDAAVLWRKMMLNVMGEMIGGYFRGSAVNNYVVRVKDQKVEILIGDDDHMVEVDMPLFNADSTAALDDAYNRFVANVR